MEGAAGPITAHAWESFYVIVGSTAGALTGLQFVVHFCVALLVVLRRALIQRDYKPVLEDWVWHTILPILSYAALVYAGVQVTRESEGALFLVGGAVLLLVFIGIHNAWDTVVYVTIERARRMKR